MDDGAMEKILRAAMVSGGTKQFWRVIAKLKSERVNPDRGKKMDFPWPVIKMAYHRQHGICAVCHLQMALDRKIIEGDHWDPNLTEDQGLNRLDNCRAVHGEPCNRKKGSKSPMELAQSQGRTMVDQLNYIPDGEEPHDG